jgi:transcriptional regulator with XRE-family HTH domain
VAAAVKFSGEKLRQERLRRGWTQSDLARRATVREQQIFRWERAENTPSADAVAALAGALEVDLGELYERPDPDDDEESETDRVAAELERLGYADMAKDLRERVRYVPKRRKVPAGG